MQRLDNNARAGMERQNIVHAGKAFADMIDQPASIGRTRRYCDEDQTLIKGLFFDVYFASIRRTGGFFPMNSGRHEGAVRNP